MSFEFRVKKASFELKKSEFRVEKLSFELEKRVSS